MCHGLSMILSSSKFWTHAMGPMAWGKSILFAKKIMGTCLALPEQGRGWGGVGWGGRGGARWGEATYHRGAADVRGRAGMREMWACESVVDVAGS